MSEIRRRPAALAIGTILCGALIAGCFERTARVQTDPPGALVIVNDEEVGVSPVKFAFLWYGDYDIQIRKAGYETLQTHHRLNPPWHQYPPFDIVTELMLPFTIRDEHELPTYALTPTAPADPNMIVERALEIRERAMFEGP